MVRVSSGLACAVFGAAALNGFALTDADIAARAYNVVQQDLASYDDYTAELTQVTKDKEGQELARVKVKVYFKKPDKTRFEILAYYEKGEKKEVPEQKEGGGKFEIKYPLDKKYYGDYTFTYKATEAVAATRCYKLAFASAKRSEGYIYGSAWVAADTFKLVKAAGQPYKQPRGVSRSNVTMYFKDFAGRNMTYKSAMYAKVSFLLFINKDLYITSHYSNYQFNQGLGDAAFE